MNNDETQIISEEVESAREVFDRVTKQAGEDSFFEIMDGYFEFAGIMVDELRRNQTFLEDQIEIKDKLIDELMSLIGK